MVRVELDTVIARPIDDVFGRLTDLRTGAIAAILTPTAPRLTMGTKPIYLHT